MGLSFLISVTLARILDIEEFGIYTFAMSVISLLSGLATFGFPQLLVREIASYRVTGDWSYIYILLQFSQRITLHISLVLALLVIFGLWLFPNYISPEVETVFVLATLALPFMVLIQLQVSALRGFDKILESQMVNGILRPSTFILLIGVIWLLDHSLLNAVTAMGLQVITNGIALLTSWFLLRRIAGVSSSNMLSIHSNKT